MSEHDDMASALGEKLDALDAEGDIMVEPTYLRLHTRVGSTYPPTYADLIVETAEGVQLRGVQKLGLRVDDDGYVVATLEVAVNFDLHAQLEGFALQSLTTQESLEKVAEQRNAAREATKALREELRQAFHKMSQLRALNINLVGRLEDAKE